MPAPAAAACGLSRYRCSAAASRRLWDARFVPTETAVGLSEPGRARYLRNSRSQRSRPPRAVKHQPVKESTKCREKVGGKVGDRARAVRARSRRRRGRRLSLVAASRRGKRELCEVADGRPVAARGHERGWPPSTAVIGLRTRVRLRDTLTAGVVHARKAGKPAPAYLPSSKKLRTSSRRMVAPTASACTMERARARAAFARVSAAAARRGHARWEQGRSHA